MPHSEDIAPLAEDEQVPRDAPAAYAHLLRGAGDCIYIRQLSYGHACCTQLVRTCATDRVCVRKAIRRRALGDEVAVDEFHRDARIAARLHAAADAAGHRLRVPRLLAAGPGASHWDLCNGGTLFGLLARCDAAAAVLPEGLALHLLLQLLETLHFMYTSSPAPLYHRDLHECNILLHFPVPAPGAAGAAAPAAVPDAYVIDFGRAAHARPQPGDFAPCADDDDPHALPWWDMQDVLVLVRDRLAPLCLPPRRRLRLQAEGRSVAAYLADRTTTTTTGEGRPRSRHPLRTAYQMLEDLHREFARRVTDAVLARRAAHRGDNNNNRSSSSSSGDSDAREGDKAWPRPPSLAAVLAFLRAAVPVHLDAARHGREHAVFRERVLAPARERAWAVAAQTPRACRSVARLLEWLDDEEGVPGPWDVAVLGMQGNGGMAVREVLVGLGRGREKVWSWERDLEGEDGEEGGLW